MREEEKKKRLLSSDYNSTWSIVGIICIELSSSADLLQLRQIFSSIKKKITFNYTVSMYLARQY